MTIKSSSVFSLEFYDSQFRIHPERNVSFHGDMEKESELQERRTGMEREKMKEKKKERREEKRNEEKKSVEDAQWKRVEELNNFTLCLESSS